MVGSWLAVRVRIPLVAALLAILLGGCFAPQPAAAPDDAFPADPDAGHVFTMNATQADFALHLDVPQAGRVAYRVLAREGAHVDACLVPGWDVDAWWANHTVPVRACSRDLVIAHNGTALDVGPWSLAIRAYGCPGTCRVAAVVDGASARDAVQGPPDLARIEAREAAACPMC
jgi:hypothetical protein